MRLLLVETEIALAQGWEVDLVDPRDTADVVDVEQARVMRRAPLDRPFAGSWPLSRMVSKRVPCARWR